MYGGRKIGGGNSLAEFMRSPLECDQARPMRNPGDWIAAAGLVLFIVSVFALPWINIRAELKGIGDLFNVEPPQVSKGLFASPWAWVMVVVLVAILAGFWFVQTRGVILLGSGIFCLIFNVVFYIGAWKKINAIIGNIVSIARSVPVFGEALGELVGDLMKEVLIVRVGAGFYLMIAAGILLIAGGVVRMVSRRARPELPPVPVYRGAPQ